MPGTVTSPAALSWPATYSAARRPSGVPVSRPFSSGEARKVTSRFTFSALTSNAGGVGTGLSIQSATKMLVSCSTLALRLLAKTRRFPSGLNMGNPSKVGFAVTCSRPVPSRAMRYRSKSRRWGSPRLLAKMRRLPSGVKKGQKLAAPLRVTWWSPVPSAFMTKSSMWEGRTRCLLSRAWYSASSLGSVGCQPRKQTFVPSGEKKAPPS